MTPSKNILNIFILIQMIYDNKKYNYEIVINYTDNYLCNYLCKIFIIIIFRNYTIHRVKSII